MGSFSIEDNSPDFGNSDFPVKAHSTIPCCHPNAWPHQLFAALLMFLLSFGLYFAYDNPAALQDDMISSLDISVVQFTAFYSVYSWPNIFIMFLGGIVVDLFLGRKLGAVIFTSFIVVGQSIFALGAFIKSYPVMLVGRFVFGLGGDNTSLSQTLYLVAWFKDSHLTLSMSIQICMCRIASTLNLEFTEPIFNHFCDLFAKDYKALGATLFMGVIPALISLICAASLYYLDGRRNSILGISDQRRRLPRKSDFTEVKRILTYPKSFWLVCGISVTFVGSLMSLVDLSQVYIKMKWDVSESRANFVTSLLFITAMCCSPLFGVIIGRTGRNVVWMLTSSILSLAVYTLFAFSFASPYFSMALLGLSFAMLTSGIRPVIAFILPEFDCGRGYGIQASIQNIGLAIFPLVAGALVESFGYIIMQVFFIVIATLCISFCILLFLTDASGERIVNASQKERKEKLV